jgi:hypothetical protein
MSNTFDFRKLGQGRRFNGGTRYALLDAELSQFFGNVRRYCPSR